MLTLLSVYSESARQDFLLPTAENVTLCARADRFGLGRDIALTLSAAGGWHFTGPCTASLRHAGIPYAGQPVQAGDSLAYCISGRVALVLLVRQQASPFAAYDRYRVRPGSIYIGSAADCGLQFTFSSGGQQYITQYHAELRFDGTSFGIYDRSRNGVFVNGRRARGSAALAFGDEVDIWGLSLVILNGGLAVRRLRRQRSPEQRSCLRRRKIGKPGLDKPRRFPYNAINMSQRRWEQVRCARAFSESCRVV